MRGFFSLVITLKPDDTCWETRFLILLLRAKQEQQQVQSCVRTFEGVNALGYVDTAEMKKCLFPEYSRHSALHFQLF